MSYSEIDPLTKEEISQLLKEPIIKLETPFVDAWGNIQPLVDRLMKSAVLINSKKGSLRANHYHKTDWHYCFVLNGEIEYYHRKTVSKKEPEILIVKKDLDFSPQVNLEEGLIRFFDWSEKNYKGCLIVIPEFALV